MDSYTLYEDLSVKWDATFRPESSPVKPMYHIQVDVAELNHTIGSSRSPHYYQFLAPDKKPTEITVGAFRIEGSKLVEKLVGIDRELMFHFVDKNGEKQMKTYKFSGVFDGGFVHKLPEIIRKMQEFNTFGSFGQLNEVDKLKAENAALRKQVADAEALLASERSRIEMLIREIERLREAANLSIAAAANTPPPQAAS